MDPFLKYSPYIFGVGITLSILCYLFIRVIFKSETLIKIFTNTYVLVFMTLPSLVLWALYGRFMYSCLFLCVMSFATTIMCMYHLKETYGYFEKFE